MEYWIVIGIILFIIACIFIISYICFRITFYTPRKENAKDGEILLPPLEIYQKHKDLILKWMGEVKKIPYNDVEITSFDGLKLHAKYYECNKGAPIELMFHGYRGNADIDLCGGIKRSFVLGYNVLLVDHRASGKSEGKVISFGINESRDCFSWIEFLINKFGKDVKIILTGISMGASTVLMASGKKLPKNVIGVIADCGYTSTKEIIKKVIGDMKLPPSLAYPFVKLGAKIYGRFNLEEYSPIEAMKTCQVPVIFIHGEADDYVPSYMSKENYNTCISKKKLVTIKGAGHGLAYVVDPDKYISALKEFFNYILRDKE